ncbi:hypothetical protein D3C86_1409190 [compost metagenome]
MSQFKGPGFGTVCSCKTAFFMTEQFAQGKFFGEATTVYGNVRSFAIVGLGQTMCHRLFTGTGFSINNHTERSRGYQVYLFIHPGGTHTDSCNILFNICLGSGMQGFCRMLFLPHRGLFFLKAFQLCKISNQLFYKHRSVQTGKQPLTHQLDRFINLYIFGDENHICTWGSLLQGCQNFMWAAGIQNRNTTHNSIIMMFLDEGYSTL